MAIFEHFAQAVFVHNRLLLNEFKDQIHKPLYYTPNGVDTTFYKPRSGARSPGPLRVGWTGSLANHGHKRGYFDYILPALMSTPELHFHVAAREWKWRNRYNHQRAKTSCYDAK